MRNVLLFLCGCAAGSINGTFGAGGGMILLPMLSFFRCVDHKEFFSAPIVIILPITALSLLLTPDSEALPFSALLPYLCGSAAGGAAALYAEKIIPAKWLHRLLGIFILWGGVRYLW